MSNPSNPRIRIGTSSFSHASWVGPLYPARAEARTWLAHYATHFDAVEIDATWYGVPKARLVDGWAQKTPDDFRISAKFPRSIVHGGPGRTPEARQVLAPDATYDDRDAFLDVMARLGPKLDTLLLQFPYFNRRAFPSAGPFLERLDVFLRDLPKDRFRYAVEIRNRGWLGRELSGVLLRRGVGLALIDHPWMPHGDEVVARHDTATGPVQYVRLLGDPDSGERDPDAEPGSEFDPRTEDLTRWARLLDRLSRGGRDVAAFVGRDYTGFAPAAAKRLRTLCAQVRRDAAPS